MPFDPRDRAISRMTSLVGRNIIAELAFGFMPDHDNHDLSREQSEIFLEWHAIGGGVHIRLGAYDDNWRALAAMPEVISLLADIDTEMGPPGSGRSTPTVEEVMDRFIALGFRDKSRTPRDLPLHEAVDTIAESLERRMEVKTVTPGKGGVQVDLKNGKRLNIAIEES